VVVREDVARGVDEHARTLALVLEVLGQRTEELLEELEHRVDVLGVDGLGHPDGDHRGLERLAERREAGDGDLLRGSRPHRLLPDLAVLLLRDAGPRRDPDQGRDGDRREGREVAGGSHVRSSLEDLRRLETMQQYSS
jgi:hypothetical protein